MTTTNNPLPDDPKPTQTALELWTEQLAGLTDPAQADAAINTIYERLMKLHGNFTKNDMTKQAGQVEEAYNLALGIYQDLQQRQVLINGGAAAIEEVQAQRQQSVAELQELIKAIQSGSETHPRLAQYATEIRNDAETWAAEATYENAMDDIDEDLTEAVMSEWDMNENRAHAVVTAVLGRYRSPSITSEQRQLFMAFANSLTIDGEETESEVDDDSDD